MDAPILDFEMGCWRTAEKFVLKTKAQIIRGELPVKGVEGNPSNAGIGTDGSQGGVWR